jgi:hypothetical protein
MVDNIILSCTTVLQQTDSIDTTVLTLQYWHYTIETTVLILQYWHIIILRYTTVLTQQYWHYSIDNTIYNTLAETPSTNKLTEELLNKIAVHYSIDTTVLTLQYWHYKYSIDTTVLTLQLQYWHYSWHYSIDNKQTYRGTPYRRTDRQTPDDSLIISSIWIDYLINYHNFYFVQNG